MMSDGPEEVLYSPASGMHVNTQRLFDNFKGIKQQEYEAALSKFLEGNIAKHSFDDLSLCLSYLETVDGAAVTPAYREELLDGVVASNQVRRISSYTWLLDPSVPAIGEDDLSFLRC